MTKEELIDEMALLYNHLSHTFPSDESALDMLKSIIDNFKSLDQSKEPKQREVSEAIEFAEWIISNEYEFFDNTLEGNIYISDEKPNKQFTMGELYDLFKSKTK